MSSLLAEASVSRSSTPILRRTAPVAVASRSIRRMSSGPSLYLRYTSIKVRAIVLAVSARAMALVAIPRALTGSILMAMSRDSIAGRNGQNVWREWRDFEQVQIFGFFFFQKNFFFFPQFLLCWCSAGAWSRGRTKKGSALRDAPRTKDQNWLAGARYKHLA